MGVIRVGLQTVESIVSCQFIPFLFYGMFYLGEGWLLDCDTYIICIDKVPGSIVKWLVVYVYVEQYWRGQAVLLVSPSAAVVVQLNIESAI